MDYEKALEKARSAYGTGAYDDATLEFLFPQLKESEDERIRKGIIEIIKAVSGPDCDVYLDEKKQEKYIAWLEKQKEQKPWKVGANAYFTPEQKPAEWSEEDEKMLEEIINHIYTTSIQRIPARPGSDIGKSWIKFLKSLRPYWRPSKEQEPEYYQHFDPDC